MPLRFTGMIFENGRRGRTYQTVVLTKGNRNQPVFRVEIYDYIKLDLNDRANLLWDEGVFIEKYIDLQIITNLYYLDRFYVEVVLSNKDGRISEITPFKSGDR